MNNILEHGKLPPQVIEIEEAVLGAIMLEKDALLQVIDIIKPEIFYKESHQIICRAIIKLFQSAQPVDILTVTNQLRKNGDLEMVDGPYFVTQLTSRIASSANIEYHTRIIQQKYIQRELIRISAKTINTAFEDTTDAMELLSAVEIQLMGIMQQGIFRRIANYQDSMDEVLKEIKFIKENPTKLQGVPSGFIDLDRKTGGWQKQNLIIMAGRPGMGKSSQALNMAINACENKFSVAYFSLEMSTLELMKKIISNKCEIEFRRLNNGEVENFEWENISVFSKNNIPLYIDDTPAISSLELRTKAIRLKHKSDIQLIIIDYLQLMKASELFKGDNREREISKITQSLKALAKELNIPIIALSQLSRECEKRGGNKRPILSDLRESGSLEQDSDIVIFLYRPEYYKFDYFDFHGVKYPAKGICLTEIAKGRNIGTGEIILKFNGAISRFSNINKDEFDSCDFLEKDNCPY